MTFTSKLAIAGMALALILAPVPSVFAQVEAKPAGDASPVFVVDTPSFLTQTISSNQFEIQSSQLAKEKDQEAAIVEVADMIIADHTKAGEKLEALLADHPAKPTEPAALSPKHQKMLDQLQAAEGADFKALYLDMQVQAHMEAVALFRTYAGSGDDQTLVGFARETLPALETHLAHVTAVVQGKQH